VEGFPSSGFTSSEIVTFPFLARIHFEVVVENFNSVRIFTFVGVIIVENVVFESDDHSAVRSESVSGRFSF